MKKITKEYEIFSFDELSKEAKAKAVEKYNTDNDYPFLQADLREYIHESLTDKKYTHTEITPLFSLSYCQGDGLMFTGTVIDKDGNVFSIKHSGYYYHEKSADINGVDSEGNWIDTKDFEEKVYIPICTAVRDMGYKEIKWLESEENFAETCEANGYTFLSDGTMFNE